MFVHTPGNRPSDSFWITQSGGCLVFMSSRHARIRYNQYVFNTMYEHPLPNMSVTLGLWLSCGLPSNIFCKDIEPEPSPLAPIIFGWAIMAIVPLISYYKLRPTFPSTIRLDSRLKVARVLKSSSPCRTNRLQKKQ